jgi:hypothetical protein
LRDPILYIKSNSKTHNANSIKDVSIDDLIGINQEMTVEMARQMHIDLGKIFKKIEMIKGE